MKIRNDSPFAGLSQHDLEFILEMSGRLTSERLVEEVMKMHPALDFSEPALMRLVRRMKVEVLREDGEELEETMEDLAKAGRAGRTRDGALEGMRRRLFNQALEEKNPVVAMQLFRMMKEEQKEDRQAALEERRMALEEENAKQE